MWRQKIILLTTGMVWVLSGAAPLLAADDIPKAQLTQLVTQAETFREEQRRAAPTLEKAPEIVTEEEEEYAAEDRGPYFTLRSIRIDGNTVFSDDEFKEYLAPYLNRETSFAQLKTLARILTRYYRARGYVTSRAYIPPQKITDDTVTIYILEGKIGEIKVEGNKFFKPEVYREAVHLREDRIFRYQDLEGSLYFLNQKPDRRAKAYLVAGKEPETTDLLLKVEETNPAHLYYGYNNRGTKLTHRSRHEIHFDHSNFLGLGDVFRSSLSLAEEGAFIGGFADYAYTNERTGTTYHLGGSYAESMLVKHLKPFEVKGRTSVISTGLTQNFYRKPEFTADVFAGFDIKDSKTDIDDITSSFDRTRVFKVGPQFTLRDPGGRTYLSSFVNVGIGGILGANDRVDPQASRPDSGGEFVYFTGSLARIQRLFWNSFLVARASAQITDDHLPSLDQFRLGGAYSVRGYPESDALGESGYQFSAELNMPVPFLPGDQNVPFTNVPWNQAVRLVGFLDGGKTFLRERSSDAEIKDRFLLGAGFGVRVDLDRLFSLQLDIGFPIGDDSSDEKDQTQVHLSLRAGF